MKKLWKKLRLWYRPMSKRYERLLNKLIQYNDDNHIHLFLCWIVYDLEDDLLLEDLQHRLRLMEIMYPDDYKNTQIYYLSLDQWRRGQGIANREVNRPNVTVNEPTRFIIPYLL